MRVKIKLQPQFNSIYFHFTQKSKQTFYSRLALKNLPEKTCLIKHNKTWPQFFFLIFYFLRYLKAFTSIVLIVIVFVIIEKCMYVLTYTMNNLQSIVNYYFRN